MTQYLVIGVIVLWALLYSAWSLMPSDWRRAAAARIAGWAGRTRLGSARARTLQATLLQTGGCSACDSCRGCAKSGDDGPARGPIL